MPSNGEHIGGKYVIGYPHGGMVHNCFMTSMSAAREYDLEHKRRQAAVINECGVYVEHNRNKIVRKFLSLPKECEWLVMIDTDMKFEPYHIYQLLDSVEEAGLLVMTALYFGILIEPVPMWWTTNAKGEMTTLADINLDEIHELAGFGTGFFTVHRSVLEAMGERYKEDAWSWFGRDQITFQGHPAHMGEDLCFCQRLTDMGIPMAGDARIQVGHEKAQVITIESFLKTYTPRKAGEKPVERVLEA